MNIKFGAACVLKCPYDQIFGIPRLYVFVKSMRFLVNLPNFKSLRAWKVTFLAINQACSGSDVKDSKLKTAWLIISI